MAISLTDVLSILPALALIATAFVVIAGGTLLRPERRPGFAEVVSYVGLAFSLAMVCWRIMGGDGGPVAILGFRGSVRLDELALFASLTIIAATGLTIVLSADAMKGSEPATGEYYGLVLLAASGMMVLVEAQELITFFIALEVLSLALYALSGMYRRDARSNEAAIKYFVMGAFASGFVLYGMTLLYGATGSISLTEIGAKVSSHQATPQALVTVGFVMLAIGLAFKVGVVPFHQWVPDVYEGAPTSVTAFMSVAVKAAGFSALLRILMTAARPEAATWGPLLSGLAIATMIGGNLLAIAQSNVKRMLAYSSVAHTGYVLAGVATLRTAGATSNVLQDAGAGAVFYLFSYTFMTLGSFAFLIYAGRGDRDAEDIQDFAGLAKRKPWSALSMTVFMVSLAGIPPTAGFFGKFLLFKAMIGSGQLAQAAERQAIKLDDPALAAASHTLAMWQYAMVIVGVLSSAVSLYYYLRVVVYMYMKPEPGEAEAPRGGFSAALVIFTCAFVTLMLGIVPTRCLSLSYLSIQSLLR